MAEVSTIPAYILANENLLLWLLNTPLADTRGVKSEHILLEFVQLDFHRWNSTRPDHVFQHRWELFRYDYIFQRDKRKSYGQRYVSDEHGKERTSLVLACLQCLIDEYICFRGNDICIHLDKYGWWQNMLSRVSSLPVLAWAYICLEGKFAQSGFLPKREYKQLYPYDGGVENYITNHGLNDSHVHVNLCAYAEECWLCALNHSKEEWDKQREKYEKNPDIHQLYRQIHVDLTPDVMHCHMEIALRLRYVLVHYAGRRKIIRLNRSTGNNELIPAEELLAIMSGKPLLMW